MSTIGENLVQSYLELHGFMVTKIPETSIRKSPDFLVEDGNTRYIIEVKDKDNQKFIDLLYGKRECNKVDLEFDNVISRKIRKGAKQLNSYKKQGKIFKVLWFCVHADLFVDSLTIQIGKTLYGLQELEGYKNSGKYFQTLCFYFTFSEFYKNKQLDAVVVHSPNEIVLCVNDFSVQLEELHQTKLYHHFVDKGFYIIEPSKSRFCIADDFSLDRNNNKAVAEYIGHKYNMREIRIPKTALFNL